MGERPYCARQRVPGLVFLLALLASVLSTLSCGSGSSSRQDFASGQDIAAISEAPTTTVATVSVTPPVASIPATVNQQLTATALYTNKQKKTLTSAAWSVSDATVANVSASGLVTGLRAGKVTVTARDPASGVSGTGTVTVTAATLVSIRVTPAHKRVAVGASVQYTATGTFSDGTKFALGAATTTWASTDSAIATVGNTGVAKGLANGTVAITATDAVTGLSGKAVLCVGRARLRSIEVTPRAMSVPVGSTQAFVATGKYSDGSTLDLTDVATWKSSNAAVASVSNASGTAGKAAALEVGTTIISAKVLHKTDAAKLTVTGAVLTSIAITPATKSLPDGTTLQLTATGTYSDATTHDITTTVTWTSSSAAVAVSNAAGSEGLATALGLGVATVTAADPSTGISATAQLTVTAAVLTSLSITPLSASVALGYSQQFRATGTFSDSTTQDLTATVTWSATSPAVASISNAPGSAGLAASLKVGTTSIGALDPTSGITAADASLTVTPAVLTALSVSPPVATIANGLTQQFTATGIFSDGSHQDLTSVDTWSVTSGAATISNAAGSAGLAASNGVGTSTIQVVDATRGVTGTATLVVTAATVVSIGVTPAAKSIPLGTSQQFVATGIFTDNTAKDLTQAVTWSTSNGDASVSNAAGTRGLATATGLGTATVTATYVPAMVSGSTTLTVTAAALVSIGITPALPTLPAGLTQPLAATGMYTDGTTQDLTATVTWSSSPPSVAAVSNLSGSKGLATAIAPGVAVVSAVDPATGITGSTSLTVTSAVLDSIAIAPPALILPLGTNRQLTATGTFSDGSTKDITTSVTWSASGGAASVSNASGSAGLVSTAHVGTATVTATDPSSGRAASASVTVTAAVLVSVAVSPAMASVPKGLTQQFVATGTYTDGSTQDLTQSATWSSSAPSATISNAAGSAGLATATSLGVSTISAIDPATGIQGSAAMTTTAALLVSIRVTPPSSSLLVGGTTQLDAVGTYDDGTTLDLTATATWTSSGPAVSVSNAAGSAGLVTGASAGMASVTATDPTTGIAGSASVSVFVLAPTTEVAAGGYDTCALRNGTVECWGWNLYGQLGNGTTTDSPTPVVVPNLSGVAAVSAGYGPFCALLAGGTVECWGDNAYGELGNGSTTAFATTPVALANLSGVTAISAGLFHACALLSNGTVACWGDDAYGQLGDGTTTNSSTPVAVKNLSGVAAVSAGANHSCALLSNGTIACWGENMYGQLGNGTRTNSSTPVAVTNLTGAAAISVGLLHTCALLLNGTAECWGQNRHGELGNGTTSNFSSTPVAVSNLSGVTGLSVGDAHTCALLSGGNVACWGNNSYGQLGNGTTGVSTLPVAVSSLSGAVGISAGLLHTCALLADSTVECWGYNRLGELGDGTTTDSSTPVQVMW
jgi:alpha-tubulin suppressor-like RCC1 family protein